MTTQNALAAGVIGLGSMGLGMAQSMVKRGIKVAGFDINAAAVAKLAEAGGGSAASVADVARNADVLLVVVVNAAQTDTVLFGEKGAAAAMKRGSVIISSATMAPDDARKLAAKAEALGLLYLDAPISGGAAKAAIGQLTVMASGTSRRLSSGRGRCSMRLPPPSTSLAMRRASALPSRW